MGDERGVVVGRWWSGACGAERSTPQPSARIGPSGPAAPAQGQASAQGLG